MGLPNEIHPLQLCASSGAYQINQSLRFNSADSTRLSRTTSGFGITTTCTISWWHKKAAGSTSNTHWMIGTYPSMWSWESTDTSTDGFRWVNKGGTVVGPSGSKYRDYSGWYHWIITQNGTVSKVYLNGVLIKQDNSNSGSSADGWHIGSEGGTDNFLNGYLAEFIFLDGIAVTDATSFGETDSITGAWIPKKYTGSFGTDGFYLKFDPSATNGIGHDHSGNGNNFTATGFSTSGTGTDVMSDTPTNNYVTWNPLTGYGTYSEGNLRGVTTTNDPRSVVSSMSVNGGKWYCEVTCTSITVDCAIGITPSTFPRDVNSRNYSFGDNVTYYSGTGNKHVDGSSSAYGSSYATNDVIGIALDIDNNQLTFYKNGVSQGTISKTFSGFYNISCTSGASADSQTVTLNGGQRSFEYTQPSGFKAWNTANLPDPTIKKGGAHFNTVLYTGTGSSLAVTGVGFQPGFTWIKNRGRANSSHVLVDAVRGALKGLSSNTTTADTTFNGTDDFKSFDSDGFTVGPSSNFFVNSTSDTHVAWNWKANGAGSSNTAGSITSTVSANATAGFSIVTYTSPNNAADQTVGHGLGVKPSLIIVKNRDLTYNWDIYHASLGYNASLIFTSAGTRSGAFGAEPTSTVFTTKTGYTHNSTNTYVAYCFSEVAGYSKFGSYTGNGSSDGPFVFCGFKPAWIMMKSYTNAGEWYVKDTRRDPYNPAAYVLKANLADQDANNSGFYEADILSNGFKLRTSNTSINQSSQTYIFAAFAEHPFKYANAR